MQGQQWALWPNENAYKALQGTNFIFPLCLTVAIGVGMMGCAELGSTSSKQL